MRKVVQAVLLVLMLGFVQWAMAVDMAPEKIKTYAGIYPDLFVPMTQMVSNRPTGGRSQAVSLLLKSFSDDTDVDGLSAVLRPSDRSMMKSDTQITQLMAAKGLSMEEYRNITHMLATDPKALQLFYSAVDTARMQKTLMASLKADPERIRDIHDFDQQVIVRNLIDKISKGKHLSTAAL